MGKILLVYYVFGCVVYTTLMLFCWLVSHFLGKIFGSSTKAEKVEEKFLRKRQIEEPAPPIAGGPIL